MFEIERKFRLTALLAERVKEYMHRSDARMRPVRQIDSIYLLGIKSFEDFNQGMPVIRIRAVGDATKITYKRAIDKKGSSIEHELDIASAQTMEKILLELGFNEVTKVIKNRSEVKIGKLAYALDEIESLGWFLEIEGITNTKDDIDGIERDIMAAAKRFDLTQSDVEVKKYDQLIAQQHTN